MNLKSVDIGRVINLVKIIFFRGAGAFSMLGAYFVIARIYKPEVAADFMFLLTVITLSAPILMFGFNTFSVKSISILNSDHERWNSSSGIIASYAKRVTSLVALSAAVIIAAAVIFRFDIKYAMAFAVIGLSVPVYNIIAAVFQGEKKYEWSIFISNICNNLVLASLVSFVWWVAGTGGVSIGANILVSMSVIVTLAISVSAYLFRYRKEFSAPKQGRLVADPIDASSIKKFWLSYVLIAVGTWMPQISFYVTGARVEYTYFSVAERLSNIIVFFSIVSNFYLAPLASRAFGDGNIPELKKTFERITALCVVACAPIAIFLIAFPGPILHLFRSGTDAAAIYAAIMASAQFVNVMAGSVNTVLIMTGNEGDLIRSQLIAIGLEIVSLAALAPFLGGVGFAVAYAIYIVSQSVCAAVYLRRNLGISVLDVVPSAIVDLKNLVSGGVRG